MGAARSFGSTCSLRGGRRSSSSSAATCLFGSLWRSGAPRASREGRERRAPRRLRAELREELPSCPMRAAPPDAGQRGAGGPGPAEARSGGGELLRLLAELKPPSFLLRDLASFMARVLLYLAPVYLAGYLGLSSSWVLIGLLLWIWWRRNRRGKQSRLLAAFGLLEDEKQAISQGIALQQLPAWFSPGEFIQLGIIFEKVHFPDVERVEWLNKVLEQTWPYFGGVMEKTFKDVVEPKIRSKNVHLKTCTFTKVHIGNKCPKIKGVKAYTKEVDRRQVILDVQIW
ncbi:UNVERIFIED_CONTAM: hypothetical protein K2H54_023195 [Gekko kuhli]